MHRWFYVVALAIGCWFSGFLWGSYTEWRLSGRPPASTADQPTTVSEETEHLIRPPMVERLYLKRVAPAQAPDAESRAQGRTTK